MEIIDSTICRNFEDIFSNSILFSLLLIFNFYFNFSNFNFYLILLFFKSIYIYIFIVYSVLLTAMSTTLSIGLLPLWFFVYSSVWTNSVFITASPEDVAMYLSIIILPMGCGMIVRALVPKAAKYLAKVRTICYVTIPCRGLERQVNPWR